LLKLALKANETFPENQRISEYIGERGYLIISSLLPLNIYNVRSFACHDLLTRKEYSKPKVRFVMEESKKKKPEDYPRSESNIRKSIKALKREFKKYTGKLIPHNPLIPSQKPRTNPK